METTFRWGVLWAKNKIFKGSTEKFKERAVFMQDSREKERNGLRERYSRKYISYFKPISKEIEVKLPKLMLDYLKRERPGKLRSLGAFYNAHEYSFRYFVLWGDEDGGVGWSIANDLDFQEEYTKEQILFLTKEQLRQAMYDRLSVSITNIRRWFSNQISL